MPTDTVIDWGERNYWKGPILAVSRLKAFLVKLELLFAMRRYDDNGQEGQHYIDTQYPTAAYVRHTLRNIHRMLRNPALASTIEII